MAVSDVAIATTEEALSVTRVSHGIDRVAVSFDDPNLVANAGLLLVATLVIRLGLDDLINATVCLAGRVGGAMPGRKALTLVHAIVAGGSHIEHADILRPKLNARRNEPCVEGAITPSPRTASVAPALRQLEAVIGVALTRAWAAGAGPGAQRLAIDVDPTICEVAGHTKQGAAYGYTKELGYHPW
jgi:hypothetical protein